MPKLNYDFGDVPEQYFQVKKQFLLRHFTLKISANQDLEPMPYLIRVMLMKFLLYNFMAHSLKLAC